MGPVAAPARAQYDRGVATTKATGLFHGVLKRLDVSALEPDDQELIHVLFPGIMQTDERIRRWGENREVIVGRTDTTLPRHGRYGRFAGLGLGRGRYSTVCRDGSGADGGTLVRELMTYWYFADDPWDGGPVLLIPKLTDTTADPDSTSAQLLIDAQVYDVKRKRRGVKFKESGHLRRALPLSVQEVEIDDVVDLRRPKTQRWFLDHMVKLEQKAGERGTKLETGLRTVAVKLRRPETFVELLPTLVEPGPGGTIFCQAVGAWMRGEGVAGLVYPSARRDVSLKKQGDQIRFEGWNFVDYRDAPVTEVDDLFGRLPKWVLPKDIGITIETKGKRWEIEGADRGERIRFEIKRQQVLGEIEHNVPDARYYRFKGR